ncbi:MAG: hypothetical protein RL693_146 [Verrucomicrobiota bacterium]|jgi:hypothetical protein
MTRVASRAHRWLTHPLTGALGFGLLIWLVLPWMVVTLDDDFGYLRSVVETCQRGRPWTYEWLTPWGASMSVLAASLFKITGSFSFAIHFSLALSAALGFLGLSSFLKGQGISGAKSLFISFLLLSSPTVLFMSVMFTSVALYLGCFWLCLWMYQRKQWGWFFLFWFVAFSARQSAIVWLALPGWTVLMSQWKAREWLPRDRATWPPLLVIAGGGLSLLLLKAVMNPTYGQAIVSNATKGFHPHGISIGLSLLALAAGYGWSCFAALLYDAQARTQAVGNLRSLWRWAALVLVCGAGHQGAQWFLGSIESTHSAYGDVWAEAWFGLLGITAGMGIVFRPVLPRLDMLGAGMGATALLALYGGIFDYYYIDGFFWGFASAIVPVSQHSSVAKTWSSRVSYGFVLAIMALFFLWDVRCYIQQKYELDRAAGVNTIYEQSLRAGKLKPHELGLGTFGYTGWRFERYFHTHEGRDSGDLAGFMKVVDGWNGKEGMSVITELPKSLSRYKTWFRSHSSSFLRKNPDAITVAELKAPLLWFFKGSYYLKKMPTPVPTEGRIPLNYGDYVDRPFPLNDAEWRQLINTGVESFKSESADPSMPKIKP